MQTPAGKECRHYYEDFHRGRNIQTCRLVEGRRESLRWHPKDCKRCPIPDILQANSDPDMVLTLTIESGLLGLGRKLVVEAHCIKHHVSIENPYVGCPECAAERPGLDLFRKALEDDD